MQIKRILFIGQYPNSGDKYLNVFFQNLIFAIADKGIECIVISPVSYTHYRSRIKKIPKECKHKTKQGNVVKVYYPRYISYSSKNIGRWNTGRLTEKAFQRTALKMAVRLNDSIDCVYGHFFLQGGLSAIRVGRKLSIPAFIAFGECDFDSQVRHDYGDLKPSELIGLSGIISVSTDNCNELKTMDVFDPYQVLLAPNAVDTSLFHQMDKKKCRTKLGIPLDIFLVGFVGGFIERKGDKRVLAAINQLDNVYGAFAGRGEKPVGDRVVFCDALDHDMVPTFLNACDVFVLPTLSEGSCNAVIEAMACGLPIISSNLPFNYDALDETNSILIDPMSIDEIKNAINTLRDCDLRKKMTKNSLSKINDFKIENRAKKILDFMNERGLK